MSPQIQVTHRATVAIEKQFGTEEERRKRFYWNFVLGVMIMILGVFVVVA
jgi:hypothetical protein